MGRLFQKNSSQYKIQGWIKASFTVEAAFIVPIILFTIAAGINIGYTMFQEAKASTEIQEEIQELNPVKIVRKNTLMQEVLH